MAKKRHYKRKRAKISSWKHLKSRFKIKKKLRIFSLALLVVLATAVTLAAFYLFQFLAHPLAQAEGGANLSFTWDGKVPVNFAWLVISCDSPHLIKEAAVLHLDPYAKRAVLFKVNPQTEIEMPLGFGKEKIAASFALGELSKPPCAVELATKSLGKTLALPLCGYFLTDEAGHMEASEILGPAADWAGWGLRVFPKIPALFFSSRENLRTNLSLGEVLRVARFLFSLREDQRFEVLGSEPVGEFCADEQVKLEGMGILILNGTSESGLASRAAKRIENLGGKVLDVGNTSEPNFSHSVILARDPTSYTASALARALEISDLRSKGGTLRWEKRADIVLILGLDKVDVF